jgi:HD superfamily phosphohydrolase
VPEAPSPGRIRDPIHGYVAFTGIERALLDHPIAQRLRYIGQSAAAHLVFPEMRVSRMAHSLGAMHLASRFLDAALANSAPAERNRILAGCRNLVERHAELGLGNNAEAALADQGLLTGRDHDEPVTLLLVEQGLRLASLVHDLGHLPYSHDFEQALEDHWRANPQARDRAGNLTTQGPGGDAVHERIGYSLASVVQRDVFNERLANGPLGKPAEVALLVARDILDAPAAPELDADGHAAVLSWLHSLVAGELDVDRADYVLRDVRHYGLTAAGYDLDRLVDHLIPIARTDGTLETAVLARGVSAAESFLVARFRMYTWAVYHHKIQQAAAGLRVAIVDLLGAGAEPVRIFLDDLEAIAGGTQTQEALDRFVDYDDGWWTGLMRERLRQGCDPTIEPWLALFVRRRPGPVSLWKRASDFPVSDRAAWNASLPSNEDFELLASWQEIRTALRQEGILVERLPFRPWRADSEGNSALQIQTPQGPTPLTRLSPLVRALATAWAEELQVLAFADRADRTTPAAVLERLRPALRT